jgi:dienelactone hydrolase
MGDISDLTITNDSPTPSEDLSPISYLAKPSGVCSVEEESIHSGNPRGSFSEIADVKTYVSRPPDKTANGYVLFFFPDVWGMYPNSLLIMDGFADAGYLVLGIDYFRGDGIWKHRTHSRDAETNAGFDYESWTQKHMTFADDVVPKWVKAAKGEYAQKGTSFACVGYSFGARYVCDLLSTSTCTAGAIAHPSFLQQHHFANLQAPLFMSCAESDQTFDDEARNLAVSIMKGGKKEFQLQLFSGVEHGFALRGDMENKYERWVKESSLRGVVEWFDFWLG